MAAIRTRVETPDLGPPQDLRVPTFGGDTYVQPERPVINNDMERLSQSLAGFSQSLAGFARAFSGADQKTQDQQAKEAADRFIASSTSPDLYKAVMSGQAPYAANHAAKGAYDASIGMNIGNELKSSMLSTFGPGGSQSLLDANGNPVDVDKLATSHVADYLGRIPQGSPHAAASFRALTESTILELKQKQQAELATRNGQMRDTTIATGFRNVLQAGDLSQLSPEQVAARVRTSYAELQGVTHATWAELDDKLVGQLKLSLADNAATPQNARNVLAILDAPRKDVVTGQDIGALSRNPRYAEDATVLRAEANKVLGKEAEAQARAEMSQQARAALERGDGSFDAVQDVYFTNPYTKQGKLIPAKEIKDAAVVAQAQDTRSKVASQLNGQPAGVVNAQVFQAQASQFIPSGVINPEWQGYLKSSVKAAGDTTSLTDPAAATRLKQAANLYEALRTRSPSYVDAMLDDKEKGFFENYHLLRKMGKGDDLALNGAAKALEPENRFDPGVAARYQDIETKVGELQKTGGFMFFGSTTTHNLGQVRGEFIRRVGLLTRTQGVSVDDAIKTVRADMGTSVPNINGQFLFDRSPFLTVGKEPVVQRQLSDVFSQFAEPLKKQGIDSPSDLSVRFTGGHYEVIRASDGAVVVTGSPGTTPYITFTDQMLRATEQRMGEETNQKILGTAKAKKSAREVQDTTGFDPRIPAFVPQ